MASAAIKREKVSCSILKTVVLVYDYFLPEDNYLTDIYLHFAIKNARHITALGIKYKF